jgi:hypothetical protein
MHTPQHNTQSFRQLNNLTPLGARLQSNHTLMTPNTVTILTVGSTKTTIMMVMKWGMERSFNMTHITSMLILMMQSSITMTQQ